MTKQNPNRRDVIVSSAGGVVALSAGGPAALAKCLSGHAVISAGIAALTAETFQAVIGKRFMVVTEDGFAAQVELTAVERIGRDREAAMARKFRPPFFAVFRQVSGAPVGDGMHLFKGPGLGTSHLMVTGFVDPSGRDHLEAIFA